MANEENKAAPSSPKPRFYNNKKRRRSFAPPKGSTPSLAKEAAPAAEQSAPKKEQGAPKQENAAPKKEQGAPRQENAAPKKEQSPRPNKNRSHHNRNRRNHNRPRPAEEGKNLSRQTESIPDPVTEESAASEEIFVAPTQEAEEFVPVLPADQECGGECASCAQCPAKESEEELPKVTIVGIRFKEGGKIYYFAPGEMLPQKGEAVIVETSRGMECGTVAVPPRQVTEASLASPLKPLLRFATEQDKKRVEQMRKMEAQAKEVWNKKLASHKLEMTLVDVEYTFDLQKLIFYFTAEGRVDFRDFVKELATVFKTRIELRQIGVRDEAKQIGGLGVCGRPFCCKTFLDDFQQVSIKMAKEQNLSLNSVKISGTCGRLMCCLRYENETYELESRKTPKVDTAVITPDGRGVVTENNVLKGTCKVRLDKKPDLAPTEYHRDDLKVLGRINKQSGKLPPEVEERLEKDEKND